MEKTQHSDIYKNEEKVPYEQLGFRNHFIFGKVMSDRTLCMKLLNCLTGNEIDSITDVTIENETRITYDSKGIRYDVYVEDSYDRIYDAEMQNYCHGIRLQLPYRSRFYQGLIDLMALEKGTDYTELKPSFVIFICTFDPFKSDEGCCIFKNICIDNYEVSLNDGRTILFFNTKGDLSKLSKEQSDLLNYIGTGRVNDSFTKELDNAVKYAHQNKEWRAEYMRTLVYNNDLKNEGRREGRQEGLQALVSCLKGVFNDFELIYNKIISTECYSNITREEVRKYL